MIQCSSLYNPFTIFHSVYKYLRTEQAAVTPTIVNLIHKLTFNWIKEENKFNDVVYYKWKNNR